MSFGIAQLNRAKPGLGIKQRVGLYHALIEPHVDYCCTVWSSAAKTLLDSICVKQRMAARAIFDYKVIVRDDTLVRLGIMPARKRWKKRLAIWLYKIRKPEVPNVPQYMRDMIPFKDLSRMGLRRHNSIPVFGRTKAGQETLAFRLRLVFQKLEDLIDKSATLSIFRASVWNIKLCDLF